MEKKITWIAILVNAALALALTVYTIVAIAIGLGKPSNTEVVLAVRVNDKVVFAEGTLSFNDFDDEIVKNDEGEYIAKKAGEFTAVVKKSGKSKITYDVTVYDYGTGTEEDPYNITKASDLFDLVEIEDGEDAQTIYNNMGAHYALRADIDLAGKNWIPVGQRYLSLEGQVAGSEEIPYFTGVFDGNGHVIKNMTIEVNEENIADFLSIEYTIDGEVATPNMIVVDLGFFGVVRGNGSKVANVSFENANISTSIANILSEGKIVLGEENEIAISAANFDVNAAVVASNVARTTIENVTVADSSIVAGGVSNYSAIGLVSANTLSADIKTITLSNNSVSANAKADIGAVAGDVFRAGANGNNGALAEDNKNTTIEGVAIDGLTIVALDKTNAYVGSVAGKMIGGLVKDVDAKNVSINVAKNSAESGEVYVAGAVSYAASAVDGADDENDNLTLQNVKVDAKIVAVAGKRYLNAAGVVFGVSANTVLQDCAFVGTIEGGHVAGLAYMNLGEIRYTDEFVGNAVDAKIFGYIAAAGVVYNNQGNIIGSEANKTQVKVELSSYNFKNEIENRNVNEAEKIMEYAGKATIDAAIEEYGLAGIAFKSEKGEIANLAVSVDAKDNLNMAGAVARLSAKLSNIDVEANISTLNAKGPASNRRAAGVVAVANSGAEISNIAVSGNINKNSNNIKSGYLMAGLVAEVKGKNIVIKDATIDMDIVGNYSNSILGDGYALVVAGAIADVEQSAIGADDNAISIKNIKVVGENRIIENAFTTLVGDQVYNKDTQGAFGLVGVIFNEDTHKVAVEGLEISGYQIASAFRAAAFGSIDGAAISNVKVDVAKITGTDVAGMAVSAGNSIFDKCQVVVYELAGSNSQDEVRLAAGFVASFRGQNTVSNTTIEIDNYLDNVVKQESNDVIRNSAGIAFIDREANVAFTNVVVYATVTNAKAISGAVDAWVIRLLGNKENESKAQGTFTATNVYALKGINTKEQAGVTYLTAAEMRDVNNFAFAPFHTEETTEAGYYWTIEEYPTYRYFEEVVVEEAQEGEGAEESTEEEVA